MAIVYGIIFGILICSLETGSVNSQLGFKSERMKWIYRWQAACCLNVHWLRVSFSLLWIATVGKMSINYSSADLKWPHTSGTDVVCFPMSVILAHVSWPFIAIATWQSLSCQMYFTFTFPHCFEGFPDQNVLMSPRIHNNNFIHAMFSNNFI